MFKVSSRLDRWLALCPVIGARQIESASVAASGATFFFVAAVSREHDELQVRFINSVEREAIDVHIFGLTREPFFRPQFLA
jgi:hypothetical protein